MTLFRSWQIVLTCKVTCPSAGARSSRAMTPCTNGETFCSGAQCRKLCLLEDQK